MTIFKKELCGTALKISKIADKEIEIEISDRHDEYCFFTGVEGAKEIIEALQKFIDGEI